MLTTAGHDHEHDDGDAEAGHPAESGPSRHAPIEETTAASGISPLDVALASIGLRTVAWVHHRQRPGRNRQSVRVKGARG
jgi:hypothetical protein